MKVKDIMSKKVITVAPKETIFTCAVKMAQSGIGALVITEKSLPLGIITERDFVRNVVASRKDPNNTKVSEVMSKPLLTTSPEDDLKEAAKIMVINEVRRLPVVENGKLVGILTSADLAKSITSELTGHDVLLYAIARYHKYGY